MTLTQTWKNCLRMWKWIDKVWKEGMEVWRLKAVWVGKHMPDASIASNCFFCEYDEEQNEDYSKPCAHCPGKLISKSFDCMKRLSYNYEYQPKKFYKKILQLNAKRKATK